MTVSLPAYLRQGFRAALRSTTRLLGGRSALPQTLPGDQLEDRVRTAIAALPPQTRAIFDAVGTCSHAEIATSHGICVEDVERHFAAALVLLDRAAHGDVAPGSTES